MRKNFYTIILQNIHSYGERSSVGRAPDCDSGRRGFESHRSPHFFGAVSSAGRAGDS